VERRGKKKTASGMNRTRLAMKSRKKPANP
jgi:hypothetical protein